MGKITRENSPITADEKERLRGEIRQTEAEISATLQSIEERFRPEHIKQEVKGKVRDYSAKAMVTMTDAVRQRPLPIAAIGLGVVWLLVRRTRKRRRGHQPRYTAADVVEALPKKLRKDPVGSIRNYIKLGRMAVILGSAISTFLVRRKNLRARQAEGFREVDVEPVPVRPGYSPTPDVQWQ